MLRVVAVGDQTTIAEIASRMSTGRAEVIRAAFEEMGLMLTVEDQPGFERLSELAAHFGFRAVREEGEGD